MNFGLSSLNIQISTNRRENRHSGITWTLCALTVTCICTCQLFFFVSFNAFLKITLKIRFTVNPKVLLFEILGRDLFYVKIDNHRGSVTLSRMINSTLWDDQAEHLVFNHLNHRQRGKLEGQSEMEGSQLITKAQERTHSKCIFGASVVQLSTFSTKNVLNISSFIFIQKHELREVWHALTY